MTFESFKRNTSKVFLGMCEQKGYVYSVQLDIGKHAVIALKNSQITVLITYNVHASRKVRELSVDCICAVERRL